MLGKGLVCAAVAGVPLLGLAVVAQGLIGATGNLITEAISYLTLGFILVIAYNAGRTTQRVTDLCRRMDQVEKHLHEE